jgi:nucleoside-diphosphate-sugar epimerase
MASYLVTGGAGFIGSHLAEALVLRGHRVTVVDNLSTGSLRNLESVAPKVTFIEGDLADPVVCRSVTRGVDYILHQAAIPSVPRSIENPVASHRANVDGTLHLLAAAAEAGVRRLVFAGSSSVYGDQPELPKREDMPSRPLSPYALQKLVGEQYCRLFTALYGLETVTLRYFNVFGPRQSPNSAYSGVISLFARSLLEGRQPVIYGDGGQTRDFTYVSNVVDAVLRACDAGDVAGQVVNVATGSRVSLNDLLAMMNRLLGTSIAARYEAARTGDIRDSEADITRARAVLGYEPQVLLEEGLRRTLDWFRLETPAIEAVPG